MKDMRLFERMNDINDRFIEEADRVIFRRNRRLFRYRMIPAAIGVAVILIGAIYQITTTMKGEEKNYVKLPILSIDFISEGMGFEGFWVHHAEELAIENPWDPGMKISSLPVFKNPAHLEGGEKLPEMKKRAMINRAKEVAAALGIKNPEVQAEPSEDDLKSMEEKYESVGEEMPKELYEIQSVFIKQGGVIIRTDRDLQTSVLFDPEFDLPKDYNYQVDASFDEVREIADYLAEKYKEILQMRKPAVAMEGGDYDINGAQRYDFRIYEREGSQKQQIVNFQLDYAKFGYDEEGKLFLIRLCRKDLSEKVGDYPIISVEEAKERLGNRQYLTSVPEVFPGMDYVKQVELVYRSGSESYWIPYYRFLVEIPSLKQENGLDTYGAYYVPAIEEQYIENMPARRVSFR